MSRAIFTQTLQPTAKHQKRIKVQAKDMKVMFFPWDFELDTKPNHGRALDAYLKANDLDWQVTEYAANLNDTGYVAIAHQKNNCG